MKFHLDGARLFNAAVALGIPASQLVAPFDSVMHFLKSFCLVYFLLVLFLLFVFFSQKVSICLSKGLGAPVGSLVVGTKSFIEQALRCRKALGGGMRQAGILAAAGIIALQKGPARMVLDHSFTKQIALAAQESGHGVVDVDLNSVLNFFKCFTPAMLIQVLHHF